MMTISTNHSIYILSYGLWKNLNLGSLKEKRHCESFYESINLVTNTYVYAIQYRDNNKEGVRAMDADGLKHGNKLMEEISEVKESIYRLNEYLGKTARTVNEPKNYYLRAKRAGNRNFAAIGEVTQRQGELMLQNLTDADLKALKKALEERLKETKAAFEEL
jgi:hypothetical protein